eukprot:NODE_9040_length_356_cov_235.046512.p3 GENE.NODE_9040_length_356_cov_235.046512~~NODE_9040_length_356_cov_235.046512.p3  ORF type:complete len:59 (+),score=35.55 NODE_9040_length_356_cov_235.046512:111-287(+)
MMSAAILWRWVRVEPLELVLLPLAPVQGMCRVVPRSTTRIPRSGNKKKKKKKKKKKTR